MTKRKKRLLTRLSVAFMFWLSAWPLYAQLNSSTCTSPTSLNTSAGISQVNSFTSSETWYSFTATSANMRFLTLSADDSTNDLLQSITLYSGACNTLSQMGADASAGTGDMSLGFDQPGLSLNSVYYLKVVRQNAQSSAAYRLTIINLATSTSCANLIGNGSFETHSALPQCVNPPDFDLFSVALSNNWSWTPDPLNPNDNLTPDYFHTTSGNIGCVNMYPSPHSGSAHGGFVHDPSHTQGREFIWYIQGTPTLQTGRTYQVTFHYKRLYAPDPAENIGVFVSPNFNHTKFPQSRIPLPKIESPGLNGYTKVTCYYTHTGAPNGVFLAFGDYNNAAQYSGLKYYFLDDVSMIEAPVITHDMASACANHSGTVTFSASAASSYSWTISPPMPNHFSSSGANAYFTIPAPAGSYMISLTATNQSGCTSTTEYPFTVLPGPPVPVISVNGSLNICQGDPFPVLSVSSVPGCWYYWKLNGSYLPTNATSIVADQPGTYEAIIENVNTYCTTTSAPVTVNVYPDPGLTITGYDPSCPAVNDGTAMAGVTGGTSPYSYAWNTNPVQTTSSAINLGTGTYSVTVTDANGCKASGAVSLTATPLPEQPIVVSNGQGLCEGTDVVYSILNYDPDLVYALTASPSAGVTISSTQMMGDYVVHYPSSCTDYTLTVSVYSTSPACSVSAQVTQYACCGCSASGNDILVDGTTMNRASQLLALSHPHITGTVYNNNQTATLYINGTFTIDVPSFTIQGSKVRMGANAKIVMATPGSNIFNVTQSDIAAGCNNMWDGIYVYDPASTVNISGSRIEDAINAVVSDGGGNYNIARSDFNLNYKGVVVMNYPAMHPGTIVETDFTTQLSPLSGNSLLLAPYAGLRGWVGVEIIDVASVTVGSSLTAQALNTFNNLDMGIRSLRSSLASLNNSFISITAPASPPKTSTAGRAIYATGGGYMLQQSPVITVGGINANEANSFKNCAYGIYAETQLNLHAKANSFVSLSHTGIYVTGLLETNVVHITDQNMFDNMLVGIHCYNNTTTTIRILDNFIDLNSQPYPWGRGIVIHETNEKTRCDVEIKKNDIRSVHSGIWTINLGYHNPALVEENTITITPTQDGEYNFGIYHQNHHNSITTNNAISSTSNDHWMSALRIDEGRGDIVTCNTMDMVGRALFFSGDLTPGTKVAKNVMDHAETGLVLNNSIIGQQGFSGTPYDNEWHNMVSMETYAFWSDGTLSPFYVQSGFPFEPTNNQAVPLFSVPFTGGNVPTSPLGSCPLYDVPLPPADGEDGGEGISAMNFSSSSASSTFTLQATNDSIIEQVKDVVADSANATPAMLQQALVDLGSIIPANAGEQVFVTVYSIILSNAVNGTLPDTTELDTLRAAAQLCPMTHGSAVYTARVVLQPVDNIIYMNPCEQAAPPVSSARLALETAMPQANTGVYPNPATGMVTVNIQLEEGESGTIELYDAVGTLTASYRLANEAGGMQVSTEKLAGGVYLYSIKVNSQVREAGKLVIIK